MTLENSPDAGAAAKTLCSQFRGLKFNCGFGTRSTTKTCHSQNKLINKNDDA